MNWSINWTQVTRNLEAIAAVSAGVGTAVTTIAPLANVLPFLVPFAPLMAGLGSIAFWLANGARKGSENLKENGMSNQGPK